MKSLEFKRGKDKQPRKKRQNRLGNHIKKGAAISGTIGAISNAAMAGGLAKASGATRGQVLAASLGGGLLGGAQGAFRGAVLGAGTYEVKKLLAKDRGKENFDYSRNGENLMFIGENDNTSINFARPVGSKDRAPRKKRFGTAAKVAGGLAAGAGVLAAGGAAIKNRKAIGAGLARAGGAVRDTAFVGEVKARQMGRKAMGTAGNIASKAGSALNSGRAATMRAGYSAGGRVRDAAAGASSAVQGGVASAGRTATGLANKAGKRIRRAGVFGYKAASDRGSRLGMSASKRVVRAGQKLSNIGRV